MRILIEVRCGKVSDVWCSEPDGAEVVIRDLEDIFDGECPDPLKDIPGIAELRVPHFVIY